MTSIPETSLPAVFVSHGSPMIAIEEGPARSFLSGYGESLPKPRAILVVSAHWLTATPCLGGAARPETIHDFGDFHPALKQLSYPVAGTPALADRAQALLAEAGIPAERDDRRGLDHGAWIPLMLLYPRGDIPVAQLSVQPQLGPAHHYRLGQALAPLREDGVLILASGAFTHNLEAYFTSRGAQRVPDWVAEFTEWMQQRLAAGDRDAVLDYRRRAPHAERNHPSEEHLLPLFVALGAGQDTRHLHQSYDHGVLAMDAYAFA